MDRLTKRVGANNEAILTDGFADFDVCKAWSRCRTGVAIHSDGEFGYQRHCNDECVLGRLIDRLAAYEDIGLAPEEIKAILGDGGVGLAIRNRDLRADNAKLSAALSTIRQELGKRLKHLDDVQKRISALAEPATVKMSAIPLNKKLDLIDTYLHEDGRINEDWAAMVREYRSMLTAHQKATEVR